ncbi:hypothetical protein ES705_19834 [subsurface metagenome]
MKLKKHIKQAQQSTFDSMYAYVFTESQLHELIQQACREQRKVDADSVRGMEYSAEVHQAVHLITITPLIKTGLSLNK